jgi:hypothetical protein
MLPISHPQNTAFYPPLQKIVAPVESIFSLDAVINLEISRAFEHCETGTGFGSRSERCGVRCPAGSVWAPHELTNFGEFS